MTGLREELLPVRGGGNGTDPGGTKPPAWQHDGAVVKEASGPDVFILFGNARFHVSSPGELTALGLSWAQVVTVPDGALAPFARVPDPGTLVRDRTAPEVWLSLGSQLWWVPSAEAMRFLGLQWGQAHILPAGSLSGLPQIRSQSASATPCSAVFPPANPKFWARTDVPGFSLPNGARIVELRG